MPKKVICNKCLQLKLYVKEAGINFDHVNVFFPSVSVFLQSSFDVYFLSYLILLFILPRNRISAASILLIFPFIGIGVAFGLQILAAFLSSVLLIMAQYQKYDTCCFNRCLIIILNVLDIFFFFLVLIFVNYILYLIDRISKLRFDLRSYYTLLLLQLIFTLSLQSSSSFQDIF